jgi:hypothetical protein
LECLHNIGGIVSSLSLRGDEGNIGYHNKKKSKMYWRTAEARKKHSIS